MAEPQSSTARPSPQAKPPAPPNRIIAPPTTAEPPRPPGPPASKEPPKESLKETIESILVAFILAFVFRAFVVEAFVIPSGSMAPTLLGAHMRFRCEECGYPFVVNFPGQDRGGDDIRIPDAFPPVFAIHCPNCGFKVRREGRSAGSSPPVPVFYGDRILVLKYLYLIQEPARWDVVVFKSPSESGRYTQNFIKRLAGKPGETLMLLNGDVYVCPNEKAGSRDGRGNALVDDWPWQVQTKPREVQNALWRVAYDQDYVPLNAPWRSPKWVDPWQTASGIGWGFTGGRRILSFSNPTGQAVLRFNKDANPGTFPLTDWLPYNETMNVHWSEGRLPEPDPYYTDQYARELIPRWYVSDVKIQFAYQRQSGEGAMRVSLGKLGHTFTAELLPKKTRLVHRLPDGSTATVGEADLPATNDLNVEFSNVDYQVTLRVNGRDLIKTPPNDYRPDMKQLLQLHRQRSRMNGNGGNYEPVRSVFPPPRIELGAERQNCQISHLSLWRDIYYTPGASYGRSGEIRHASPENPVQLNRRGTAIDLNGTKTKTENEYFVLGDNSILSSDARYWSQPVNLEEEEDLYVGAGRVPERFMLGKAFFVYWPAGFRPFSITAPGVIPNFGEMRFIH